MSHFHIKDLSKPGSIDVVNGDVTWTISYQPHNMGPCGCAKCKEVKAKKAAEEKKAKEKKAAEEKKKKQGEHFLAHLLAAHRPHT
ncbi:hypothetical protein GGI15_002448 [Coemansia interrupta]|uniref:Uncharacterized protein n=1 Tax=Coemansia interrupta TaxID=1126814 RepID=A0A9W8HF37_9FUNG|nr:hypothetical protein GGI15_002448 [Coemansia interrupta]